MMKQTAWNNLQMKTTMKMLLPTTTQVATIATKKKIQVFHNNSFLR